MRIFDVSPFNYGHRGDEVIWKYFATLSDEQYNVLVQDVESYIIAFMDSNTTMKYPEKNWGVINEKSAIGSFDPHSGLVDYGWWSETAIPLLQERLVKPTTADCWKTHTEIMEEMLKDDSV